MDDLVGLDVIEELRFQNRIVMAVVEGSCASEKVDVYITLLVLEGRTPRLCEDDGKVATVASNL
jgi:hypothetical protein